VITILGVGHVFDIARPVKEIIFGEMPGAVCIELDQARYNSLRNPQQPRNAPITYQMLARFQRRLAHQFGSELGAEMLAAADAAKEISVDLLLIDVEAPAMFARLWREMSLKERLLLFLSAFTGLFISRKRVEGEIERFEQHEEEYLNEFARQLPTMKRILIDERNQVMVGRMLEAEGKYGNIVAVVGDGHVDGMLKLLNRPDVQVVRLRQLTEGTYPRKTETKPGNAEVNIHFSV
jgi:pheromone shutdown protein TraB